MIRRRRLRASENLRALVRETSVSASDLIYPVFVIEGKDIKNPIDSMPGIYQYSIDRLDEELDRIREAGVKGVLLFGIPAHKDECGTEAYNEHGIIQEAIRYIKKVFPELVVIADICLCEYTSHGHCGVIKDGIILNDETLPLLAKASVSYAKAGADIIVSGAGLPTELPEYLKGFKTKMAPIVSSVKSAKVILKYWDRRHNATADMIIIEGPKAGGHLGFSVEELESELDYDNEIKGIIDVVKEYEKKYNKDIPVVVAGGISDKNKVKHAFDLGAQGVQVATRFVPTKECDADENYKKEYIKAKKEDIVIVKSPVGMPGRAIKNKFMEKVINGEKFTPKKCLGCLARCNPKEIPYCITERLIYAAKGKTDEALLFCGADAYKVNKITTVKKVFKELLEEKEF